ncbi:MAG: hypothetical protein RL348_16 [Bacteroidota bacterium]|jgi:hypothetical protein
MSFTATNNSNGSLPDINVRMVQVGEGSNYESQGMERAVNIGQDGRPMGKIEYVPPFDLLTEENRNIIEQRKMQKEAQKRREQEKQNQKPQKQLSSDEIIERANKDLIGRSYKYITAENFGKIVSIVSSQMQGDELQITMDDGLSIMLDDLDSMFIYDSYNSQSTPNVSEQTIAQNNEIVEKPKPINIEQPIVATNISTSLPNSPLRQLLSSRKKNMSPLSVNLTIDLVKRDFYKILDDSYDNAIDYVVEHAMSNITMEDVKNAIKYELERYYKSETIGLTDDEPNENPIYREPDIIILEKSE